MHELSLCGAIADIATRQAGERVVEVVYVRIGQLRQVVPDTLSFCWDLVASGTELDGSRLEIEHVPARLSCTACSGSHTLGEALGLSCPSCGAFEVTVEAGEEFLVTALDLAEA